MNVQLSSSLVSLLSFAIMLAEHVDEYLAEKHS